jgi:hypothetical protein
MTKKKKRKAARRSAFLLHLAWNFPPPTRVPFCWLRNPLFLSASLQPKGAPAVPDTQADQSNTRAALKIKLSLKPQATKVNQDLWAEPKLGECLLKY